MNKQIKSEIKRKSVRQSMPVILAIASCILLIFVIVLRLGALLEGLQEKTQKANLYKEIYQSLAGYNTPQRTLLILANNAEIRTGGGFVGTVGLIRTNKGKFSLDPLVGVYQIDSDKNCTTSQYTVPEYLKIIASCASLRDSGNALDFPTNAKQALYFYQLNTSQSVDNVVQVTPNVLDMLLERLGPVYLKEYDLTVTKENFRDTVQLEVESGKDKVDKKDPKSGVLGSLANQLIGRLLTKDVYELKDYVPLLDQIVSQKQLVIYSSDKTLEKKIAQVGASGEINHTDDNYFIMAEANYAGNKSSPYIKNQVHMNQTIQNDGSSIIDLTITSRHTSDYRIPYVDPNTKLNAWIVGPDLNNVTLGLPAKTQLLGASVVNDQYKLEQGTDLLLLSYTRHINTLGETTASFQYKIPTKYLFRDRLVINSFIQKQIGGWPYELQYSLTLPSDNYKLVATNASSVKRTDDKNTLYYSATINIDTILSFIYEKQQ